MTVPTAGQTVRGCVSRSHPRPRDFVLTRDAEAWPNEYVSNDRIRVFTRDDRASEMVGELREVPTMIWGWRVISARELDLEQAVARAFELTERGECDPVELHHLQILLGEARNG